MARAARAAEEIAVDGKLLPEQELAFARRIIGVGENATEQEITAAWRTRVRDFHPDVASDAETTKIVNVARDLLRENARARAAPEPPAPRPPAEAPVRPEPETPAARPAAERAPEPTVERRTGQVQDYAGPERRRPRDPLTGEIIDRPDLVDPETGDVRGQGRPLEEYEPELQTIKLSKPLSATSSPELIQILEHLQTKRAAAEPGKIDVVQADLDRVQQFAQERGVVEAEPEAPADIEPPPDTEVGRREGGEPETIEEPVAAEKPPSNWDIQSVDGQVKVYDKTNREFTQIPDPETKQLTDRVFSSVGAAEAWVEAMDKAAGRGTGPAVTIGPSRPVVPGQGPRVWESLEEVPEGVETKRLAGGRRREVLAEPSLAEPSIEEPKPEVAPPVVEEEPIVIAEEPAGTAGTVSPAEPLSEGEISAKPAYTPRGTERSPAVSDVERAGGTESIVSQPKDTEIVERETPALQADEEGVYGVPEREDRGSYSDYFERINDALAQGRVEDARALYEEGELALEGESDLAKKIERAEAEAKTQFSIDELLGEQTSPAADAPAEFQAGETVIYDGVEYTVADPPTKGTMLRLNETGPYHRFVLAEFADVQRAPVAESEPATQISGQEEVPSEARSVRETPRGAAAAEPPAGVQGAPAERPAEGVSGGARPERQPDAGATPEAAGGEAAVQPGGLEEQPGGVGGVPGEGGGRAGARRPGTRAKDRDPGGVRGTNYRVADPADLEVGRPPKQKIVDNIAAIKLLREIEGAGRPATLDEQRALAKYAGWGFAGKALDERYRRGEYRELGDEIEELLTPEEYASAKRSTPNAHYTGPEVVTSIWEALQHMGFTGGKVLEPGMGVGHFLSLIPEGLAATTKFSGVELDEISGRIAKVLFPRSDIRVQGFEEMQVPDNFYDAVIGNVPFGKIRPYDPKLKQFKFTVHNYFFAKAVELVRPGGVVAFVTSRFTMDGGNNKGIRQFLAQRADLLGAVRLPNNAFKKVANTEVTTDVIFLRKRYPGEPAGGPAWEQSVQTPEGYLLNQYYVDNPDMLLGELGLTGTMYGANELTLDPTPGADLATQMKEALAGLPRDAMIPIETTPTDIDTPTTIQPADHVKEGGYAIRDGKLVRRLQGRFIPAWTNPTEKFPKGKPIVGAALERVKKLLVIRDAAREVLNSQLVGSSDEDVAAAQAELGKLYDRFVKKFGPINKKAGTRKVNLEVFRDDPDAALVANLEVLDQSGNLSKADIFDKRVIPSRKPIEQVENPKDALLAVLNERGRIDLARMSEISNSSETKLIEDLTGLIFKNPETSAWEPRDLYLSGNVRAKLASARGATELDPTYAQNVTALEAVQPKDLDPSEIDASLGAPWIPPSDVAQFIADLVRGSRVGNDITVYHSRSQASWKVSVPGDVSKRPASMQEWGTDRVPFPRMVELALNQQQPTVRDQHADGTSTLNRAKTVEAQAKQQEVKDRFMDWVWEDTARANRLHRTYNDEMNNTVPYVSDGSHMSFPGSAPVIKGKPFVWHPHQKNAVWRALQTGNMGLFQAVGAGKTFTQAAIAMESKRVGLAHKPMIIVLDHLLEQFTSEALTLYPAAKVLMATREDLEKTKRRDFIAKVAANDWDMVIMTHPSFGKIPVSAEFETRFIKEQVTELEEAVRELIAQAEGKGDRAVQTLIKQIETQKLNMETRLKELENRNVKDDVLSFEEMGIDLLIVDESHKFKNLYAPTKTQGLAGGKPAQRATDLYMKTRYLDEKSPGRGVVFATGTPLTRSVIELFNLQRFLGQKALIDTGLRSIDAWIATFGEVATSLELRPEGGFRQYTRMAYFKNAPELSKMFLDFADIQTADMLNIPRPEIAGGTPEFILAEPSEVFLNFQETLVKRAEQVRGAGRPQKGDDNMLAITMDGTKAALDMRLIDPSLPDDPNSKVNLAVQRIYEVWKKTMPKRSTQTVFIDVGTPKKGEFNVYDDMKAKLVERGIPADEIQFIQDHKSTKAKEELFKLVRTGKVRVLFGSTEMMGEGMNVQHKMKSQWHLDVPWNPSGIEQRIGRIQRQGNENEEVEIGWFVTEKSFDGYRYQTAERKQKMINQMVRAEVSARRLEDVEGRALTYAEIKAIVTGDPLVLEKAQVDADVMRLSGLAKSHLDREFRMKQEVANIPARREELEFRKQGLLADQKVVDAIKPAEGEKEVFSITLQGKTFDKRKDAFAVLKAIDQEIRYKGEGRERQIGSFAGLKLYAGRGWTGLTHVWLEGLKQEIHGASYWEKYQSRFDKPDGVMQVVEHLPKRIAPELKAVDDQMAELKLRESELARILKEPFKQTEELQRLLIRQKEIDATLDLDKVQNDVTDVGTDEGVPKPEEPEYLIIDEPALEPGEPDPQTLGEVQMEQPVDAPGIDMPAQVYGSHLFELARQLETPARYKRLQQAFGRFKPEGAETRIEVRDVRDNFGLAHEVAHALDYRLSGDAFPSSIKARFGSSVPKGITEAMLRAELVEVAQIMRPVPGGPNQMPPYRRKHTELIADFYSLYLLDPGRAARLAPNVSEAFVGTLTKNQKVHDALQATLEARGAVGPEISVPEIRPIGQPTSLIPDDIEGDYTDAAKALTKNVNRLFRLRKTEAGKNAERWERFLDEQGLEDVGAAAEQIGNLRTGEDFASIEARMTSEQKRVLREYRLEQESMRQTLNEFLRDIHGDDYVAYVEDYLLHAYVRDPKMAKKFAGRWARKVPSAKKRRFPTLQEAVDAGFTPLTQNVAKLHRMWAELNWRGAINQRFVLELQGIVNEDGLPVIMKPKNAPPDWPVVDHPSIRQVYAKILPDGTKELWHGGAAVDPEVYKITRQVFEEPFNGLIVRTIEAFNAFAKSAALSFSLFHHWALTESANAALARAFNPLRGIVMAERGLRGGVPLLGGIRITQPHREGLRIMKNADFQRDAIMHGLNIDPIPDVMAGRVLRLLQEAEVRVRKHPALGKVPGLDRLIRGARKFKEVWDNALWGQYYTGLKALTYYEIVKHNMAAMPADATPADIRTTKEQISALVNDMFGGQEWEGKFWLTPKGRQIVHIGMLAPDWTLSNWNVASKTLLPGTPEIAKKFLRRRYWPTMLMGFFGFIATAGYALTRKWPWQNEPGHKMDINVTPIMRHLPWMQEGFAADATRQYYIKPGKQFREVVRYLTDPVSILGAKMSPFGHLVVEQATGHQAGQVGWEMPWAREEMGIYESLTPRAISIMQKFQPFALRGNNFAFTFPMSRGMSWYKAQKAYEDIIRAQVDPSLFKRIMPGRTAEKLKAEIDRAAELNGLNPRELYRQANTMVRTTYYGEMWRALDKQKMDEAERIADILRDLGVTREGIESSGERRGAGPAATGGASSLFPEERGGPRPPTPPRPPRPPIRR